MAKDDIFELTVRSLLNSQNIANVHHFQQTQNDGSGLNLDSLAEIWVASFQTQFLALLVDTFQVVDLSIRRILPTQTQPKVFPIAAFGVSTGGGLPTHACAIVGQWAEPDGRKGSGHVKICGAPVSACDEGRINLAYGTLLNAYADNFKNEQVATTGFRFQPGVFSQVDNQCRTILQARGKSRFKTCHSRQIGVGV